METNANGKVNCGRRMCVQVISRRGWMNESSEKGGYYVLTVKRPSDASQQSWRIHKSMRLIFNNDKCMQMQIPHSDTAVRCGFHWMKKSWVNTWFYMKSSSRQWRTMSTLAVVALFYSIISLEIFVENKNL